MTPFPRISTSAQHTRSTGSIGLHRYRWIRRVEPTLLRGILHPWHPGNIARERHRQLRPRIFALRGDLFGLLAEQTQIVAGTGFLSSFTTSSTFALESLQVSPVLLVGNVLATYVFGFTGVLAGRTLARIVDGGEAR